MPKSFEVRQVSVTAIDSSSGEDALIRWDVLLDCGTQFTVDWWQSMGIAGALNKLIGKLQELPDGVSSVHLAPVSWSDTSYFSVTV